MAKKVNVNDEKSIVTTRQESKSPTMIQWIGSYKQQIAAALPSVMTPERFARIAMTAVTQNPELGRCTPGSFIGSMLTAAQLGLEPNTPLGQAYLIPYNRKDKQTGEYIKECQFQLGYRGMIELAHRSGEFKDISAHIVYENDEFEYELGLDPKLKHVPAMSNRGKIAWVYAVYHLISGGYGFEVMSYDDIENHRKKYSQASKKGFSPWTDSWEAMAKKTVIKQALKYAPLATDFIRDVSKDESKLDFNLNSDAEKGYDIIQGNVVEADVEVEEGSEDASEEQIEGQTMIDAKTGEIK